MRVWIARCRSNISIDLNRYGLIFQFDIQQNESFFTHARREYSSLSYEMGIQSLSKDWLWWNGFMRLVSIKSRSLDMKAEKTKKQLNWKKKFCVRCGANWVELSLYVVYNICLSKQITSGFGCFLDAALIFYTNMHQRLMNKKSLWAAIKIVESIFNSLRSSCAWICCSHFLMLQTTNSKSKREKSFVTLQVKNL